MFDKDLPDSIRKGQRLTTMTSGQSRFPIAPSKYKFAQHGQSGMWISELLPWTARLADEIALVKTVWTEAINHDPAVTYICTGNQLPGRPSLGSWLSYGLGTMNQNLPAFVVMTASWSSKAAAQAIYNRLWGAGYLPTKHQGVALRSTGDPVLFLSNPQGVDASTRRRALDAINRLEPPRIRPVRRPRDPGPDRPVRDGVPDADLGPRADRHLERAQARPRHVRARRAQAGHVRSLLPAGPPAGRARRAVRPDLPPRLGPARQPGRRPAAPVPGRRPGRASRWSPTSSSAGCSTTRW